MKCWGAGDSREGERMGDFLEWLVESGLQVIFLVIVILLIPVLMILILSIATGIDDRLQR
jgi:hypothetical protein